MPWLKSFRIICCICSLQMFGQPAQSQNIDIDLLKSINPQYPDSWFWKTASSSYVIVSGTISLGSLAYSLIENDRALRYKSYELLGAIGINIIATEGLKRIFNRTRPYDKYPNDVFVLTNSRGYSFPSGHTSLAFATATTISLTYKKWYIIVPAYLWAGSVGYSRMYLGRHYPSDVLGGAVVGAGSSVLAHWLSRKLFEPKPVNANQSNVL
ncbi:MAG: phosphatase PAP2 family protein [Ferruginibacter sp.]